MPYNNFTTLIKQSPVQAIIEEINLHPELWETDSDGHRHILLQYHNQVLASLDPHFDLKETITYPAMLILTESKQSVFSLLGTLNGERLGRVMITELLSGQHITYEQHTENYYRTFALALLDNDQTSFKCGKEYFRPEVGDIYTFENQLQCECWNNGETPRWVLTIDIKKKALYAPETYVEPKEIEFGEPDEVEGETV